MKWASFGELKRTEEKKWKMEKDKVRKKPGWTLNS